MSNVRQLEQRLQYLERQVSGHHDHGTLASRLAQLEDIVTGDPMKESSIVDRLADIEQHQRQMTVAERIDAILGESESTADGIDKRIQTIDRRLKRLNQSLDGETETEEMDEMLDRIEARLLALETARREKQD